MRSARLAIVSLGVAVGAAHAQNVAAGKPVSAIGSVGGANVSTLVDGMYLPRGRQWQTGTVWWNGLAPAIQIDLLGTYALNAASVQADDNDAYTLLYRDIATDTWRVWWDVPNYDSFGNGMQTRPNPADDSARFSLPEITTDALRFVAARGDNSYSVSEIQAFAVPAPGAAGMCAVLGLIALRRRR